MNKITTDETTYRETYPTGVWPNSQIEIKANADGLEFDEDFTIPWEWILNAYVQVLKDDCKPQQ